MVQQPPPWDPHGHPGHAPAQAWAPPAQPPSPMGPATSQQQVTPGWQPQSPLSPPPPPPPAWYPDPYGMANARYWDGARWTEHTQPQAAAMVTPV